MSVYIPHGYPNEVIIFDKGLGVICGHGMLLGPDTVLTTARQLEGHNHPSFLQIYALDGVTSASVKAVTYCPLQDGVPRPPSANRDAIIVLDEPLMAYGMQSVDSAAAAPFVPIDFSVFHNKSNATFRSFTERKVRGILGQSGDGSDALMKTFDDFVADGDSQKSFFTALSYGKRPGGPSKVSLPVGTNVKGPYGRGAADDTATTPLSRHHIIPYYSVQSLLAIANGAPTADGLQKTLLSSLQAVAFGGKLEKNEVAWSPFNLFIGPSGKYRTDDPSDKMERTRPIGFDGVCWEAVQELGKLIPTVSGGVGETRLVKSSASGADPDAAHTNTSDGAASECAAREEERGAGATNSDDTAAYWRMIELLNGIAERRAVDAASPKPHPNFDGYYLTEMDDAEELTCEWCYANVGLDAKGKDEVKCHVRRGADEKVWEQ